VFSSAAHAQVNNEVRKVQQPIGFADIVERVKPSGDFGEGQYRRQGPPGTTLPTTM